MTTSPLLHVENLVLHFRTAAGIVQAVDRVDLDLDRGKAMVILGESGCGKTSLAKAILRLLPRNVQTYTGSVRIGDMETMTLSDEEFRQKVRWMKISMVPQAAMNSLNPVLKVGDQVAEPMMSHYDVKRPEAMRQVYRMFEHVGVPLDFVNRYAFELSGGMRQRVAIAMSLVTTPDLIILDAPTSALDVLTQANIFNVLKRIKHEIEASFILITHDIATSSELADRVAVMYAGQIVEIGDALDFFPHPLHPYSERLMASVPKLRADQEPEYITGQPPSLLDPPTGCRFAERCSHCYARCSEEPPILMVQGRQVRCWLYAPGEERYAEYAGVQHAI
jgi:peptide/nickel transport system ATP-binding protein